MQRPSLSPSSPTHPLAPWPSWRIRRTPTTLCSLSPSFSPPTAKPNPKRRNGCELTETPPLAAVDRDLPEQIELGQKLRLGLPYLLLHPSVRGRR